MGSHRCGATCGSQLTSRPLPSHSVNYRFQTDLTHTRTHVRMCSLCSERLTGFQSLPSMGKQRVVTWCSIVLVVVVVQKLSKGSILLVPTVPPVPRRY